MRREKKNKAPSLQKRGKPTFAFYSFLYIHDEDKHRADEVLKTI